MFGTHPIISLSRSKLLLRQSEQCESIRWDLNHKKLGQHYLVPLNLKNVNIFIAAETGWDFSTRWFAQEGPSMHDFKSIRTLSIVPVDLNAFMCINMRILASFYEIFGDFKRKDEYYARYQKMKLAMKTLHWNETDGIWFVFC